MTLQATAYINGNIFTVDSERPRVKAFAVDCSGRFSCVGSNDEALNSLQGTTHDVVDLCGGFVMPGIHDAHTHLLAAALQQLFEVSVGSDCTHETLGQNLAERCHCSQAHSADDWLIANFYNGSLFPHG